MRKFNVPEKMTRSLGRAGLKIKKYSPEVLVMTGIAGTVVSAVMACKATTKANDIIDELKEDMNKIHSVAEMKRSDYTEDDLKKDTAIVYIQTGVKFVKLYAPAVGLGVASITCILAGHNITRKRNVALAAAYTAVDQGFKEYRGRVVERFGKELDHELKHNIKAKEFEVITIDEDGNEKTEKKTVNVVDPNTYSDYARFFDESCAGWTKNPEDNLFFLKSQQNYANDKLKSQGYLFLNDVYEMIGLPKTKAGQIVGWIYDEKMPIGDNFVDFGIYDASREVVRDFVNGYERTILLDFNVDGNILDLI